MHSGVCRLPAHASHHNAPPRRLRAGAVPGREAARLGGIRVSRAASALAVGLRPVEAGQQQGGRWLHAARPAPNSPGLHPCIAARPAKQVQGQRQVPNQSSSPTLFSICAQQVSWLWLLSHRSQPHAPHLPGALWGAAVLGSDCPLPLAPLHAAHNSCATCLLAASPDLPSPSTPPIQFGLQSPHRWWRR